MAPGAFEAARAEMSVPTVVPAVAGGGTFSSVSAAAGYAAAVVDGRVYVWGQLPAQTGWLALLPAPVPVPLFDDVAPVEAVCGTDHIFVRSREGALHAWGGSEAGQLGLKLFGTLATPREVPPVAPEHYVAQVCATACVCVCACVRVCVCVFVECPWRPHDEAPSRCAGCCRKPHLRVCVRAGVAAAAGGSGGVTG